MTDVFTYLWVRRAVACGVAIEGQTIRAYVEPFDANERRRRIARWRRLNPGKRFWRGVPLHPDGSLLNEAELIQWRVREAEKRMRENLATNLYGDCPDTGPLRAPLLGVRPK